MSDPISSYRTTCRNADLMLGADPTRIRGDAALQLVRQTLDGVRQHRLDAPAARAAYAEGHAAMRQLPPDQQAQLAPLLSQLDTQVASLERSSAAQRDHSAPAAHRPAHTARTAASPAATVSAGLTAAFAGLRGTELRAEVQHSLFRDAAQTTRTLRALASLSPSALRETVTARVGAHAADELLGAISANARMQFRARVSERACEGLQRSAARLEAASSGAGLETTLAALHGPERGPMLTQLAGLGVNADEVRALLAQPDSADARGALREYVAGSLRDGAAELRGLAQRYDATHNMLDETTAVYGLFSTSVNQTRAQLGVPSDDTRSALGSFIADDIAAGRAQQASNDRVMLLAGLATSVFCAGIAAGVALEMGIGLVRGAANVGLAHQRANDIEAAMRGGEATEAAASAARAHVNVEIAATVAAVATGAATAGGLHHHLGHAAGLAGGGVEALTHAATSGALHSLHGASH
jgi:hypothetical protein